MSSPTSDLEPPLLGESSFFRIQTTNHGDRSLFAICDIEPGTLIHSSELPFTHVVCKDYRKEVCAQCFAYSASDHAPPTVGPSRTWRIRWSREGATTARFCSDVCKDIWERDGMSPLLMEVDALLAKAQGTTRKRLKIPEDQVKVKAMLTSFEHNHGTIGSIDERVIDAAWKRVEALVASQADLALFYPTLYIEDMELEIARSLAAAIVRRYYDERSQGSSFDPNVINTSNLMRNSELRSNESWAQLLLLQRNELCNIQTRPYMLAVYLRIYVFLSNALPKYLRKYMSSVREILSRDTGNAFGIWDGDRRDEMMGWGIWVSASYFNHSCTPNVRKRREGRVLLFEVTRRVEAGEELCVSYIDTDSPVEQRRRELEESWFFTCHCLRCEKESRQ